MATVSELEDKEIKQKALNEMKMATPGDPRTAPWHISVSVMQHRTHLAAFSGCGDKYPSHVELIMKGFLWLA